MVKVEAYKDWLFLFLFWVFFLHFATFFLIFLSLYRYIDLHQEFLHWLSSFCISFSLYLDILYIFPDHFSCFVYIILFFLLHTPPCFKSNASLKVFTCVSVPPLSFYCFFFIKISMFKSTEWHLCTRLFSNLISSSSWFLTANFDSHSKSTKR